jgi:hypothetical protein
MAVTRLSVNDAWNTVVTLLLSKRAESDFSAAPPRVSLSGEQPLCEEIFTNDDVLGRKASLIVQSRQQVQLRRQNTQPVDRKQRYSVVQPVTAVTSQFMIATSQKTLMEKIILNGTQLTVRELTTNRWRSVVQCPTTLSRRLLIPELKSWRDLA